MSEGTGTAAAVGGYDIAGKTGTTQLLDPATRAFSSQKHLATFVGFVPARQPVLSIIVVLDAPRSGVLRRPGGRSDFPGHRPAHPRYLGIPPQPSRRSGGSSPREPSAG